MSATVVIVDDRPADLVLLSEAIAGLALRPVPFTEPAAALARCASEPPDLVVVSCSGPGSGGLPFIEQFRALPEAEGVPLLAVVPAREQACRAAALVRGADDYVTRPIDPIEISARTNTLLALHQARRALAGAGPGPGRGDGGGADGAANALRVAGGWAGPPEPAGRRDGRSATARSTFAARRRTVEILRSDTARYRALFDMLPVGLLLHDVEGIILSNAAAQRMLAPDGQSLIGRHYLDFVLDAERAAAAQGMARVLKDGIPIPYVERTLVNLRGAPLSAIVAAMHQEIEGRAIAEVVLMDVTAVRSVERDRQRLKGLEMMAALADAQRQILEAVPVPLVVTRIDDGRILHFNEPAATLVGLSAEQAVAALAADIRATDFFVDPVDRVQLIERMTEAGRLEGVETQLKTVDGKPFWALSTERAFVYQGRDAIIAALNNIDERKRIEASLRESEQSLRAVIDSVPAIINAKDRESRFVFMNSFEATLYGVDKESVVGKTAADLPHAAHADRNGALDRQVIETGRAIPFFEEVCDDAHGVQHIWMTTKVPILDPSDSEVRRVVTVALEITERKHTEQALRAAKEQAERAFRELKDAQQSLIQSGKMAALGSLVAGVAHEINTPIGITLTAASYLADEIALLRRAFEEQRLRRQDLDQFIAVALETTELMLSNMHRAAELIQGFKQVAVDQTSTERRPFNLKKYLGEVLLSLRPRVNKAKAQVTVACPENLDLDGYPGALSQILTNLVINALIHGYDGGQAGHLTIVGAPHPGDQVELRVSDDGKGIPEEHLGRIFDPFFTTNRTDGTGLGLNIVFNLATQVLKGRITVQSAMGQGTTFVLTFPRVTPAETSPRS